MATCGFCKTRDLHHDTSEKDGKGLEHHYLPNTRTTCEGPATTNYTGKSKKAQRRLQQAN